MDCHGGDKQLFSFRFRDGTAFFAIFIDCEITWKIHFFLAFPVLEKLRERAREKEKKREK